MTERRAALVQAQAQLENTARQAGAEVRASIQQLQRADEALKAAREAEQEAASALALAEAVFKAGGVTNLEVIDAERRERDAQTAVALAENTARQARLELLAASGRFPQM
jgi:outer membrane protein TolC